MQRNDLIRIKGAAMDTGQIHDVFWALSWKGGVREVGSGSTQGQLPGVSPELPGNGCDMSPMGKSRGATGLAQVRIKCSA